MKLCESLADLLYSIIIKLLRVTLHYFSNNDSAFLLRSVSRDSSRLMQVSVPYVDFNLCRESYQGEVTHGMLCAGESLGWFTFFTLLSYQRLHSTLGTLDQPKLTHQN